MKRLALLGGDLSYSRSKEIHLFITGELGLSCEYSYCTLADESGLDKTAKKLLKDFDGFNVTVPYKEKIIPYLDLLAKSAEDCKSVNTVICKGKTGHSTDGKGFMLMLKSEGIEVSGKRVLMLGSGGAAKSCIKALTDAGADLYVYNRTYENALKLYNAVGGFTLLREIGLDRYDIIVNTTVLGSVKYPDRTPVSQSVIELCGALVDMIYSPKKTVFLKTGEKYGKKCVNGFKMLFFQAYFADMLFFEREGSEKEALELYNKFMDAVGERREQKND